MNEAQRNECPVHPLVGLIINKIESDRTMIEEKHNQLLDELRKLRRNLITAIDSPLTGEDGSHAFVVCLASIDELLDRYSKPNAEAKPSA